MIEVVQTFPPHVVGFIAKGQVTRNDYEAIVIPKLKEALSGAGQIRCYYELGREFSGMDPGAAWEDLKLGIEHLSRWERVAVVTDVDWIRLSMNIFRFLVPGDTRMFGTSEVSEARRWIAAH